MAIDVETRTVRTPDGRDLCLELAGDPAGVPVLLNVGTPNSRHMFDPWIEDAAARGIHLFSYDRPGYGGSTPSPGYTVADAAADVRVIAAALEIDRLAIWGFSGGGPYTLAAAALLPELVGAAAIVGSVAPFGAPGLDYFTGMGESNVEDIELYLSDPEASRLKSRKDWAEIMTVSADQLAVAMETLLTEVDAAVLTGAFADHLYRCMQDGLAHGEQGWWDDSAAHMEPWGFSLDSIHVPVKVWHGRQDAFVPFQHGEWLAANIPGAEAFLSDTDGHLTLLVDRFADVHEWLLAQFS